MARELFALGTAIYEITEWNIPYGIEADEVEVDKALGRGEWPKLSPDNPAEPVVRRCWEFKCRSADEVLKALEVTLLQLSYGKVGSEQGACDPVAVLDVHDSN